MMFKNNKRGYFFLIDATLAVVAIVVGSFIIYGSFFAQPSTLQLSSVAESVVLFNINSSTKDFQSAELSPYFCTNVSLTYPHCIDDSLTFAKQLHLWYHVGNTSLPPVLVGNTSFRELPAPLNMEIRITDTVVFSSGDSTQSRNVVPAHTVVLQWYNGSLIGPDLFEVLIW